MLLTLWLACTDPPAPPAAPVAPPAPKADPADPYDWKARAGDLDIIVISMDCLRYDRTGLSPQFPDRTPNLRAFAEQAVVFHAAQSAAAWTVPGHMSIWTARLPSRHGLVNKLAPGPDDKLVDAQLSADIPTWPETFAAAGWEAAAFTGDAGVSKRFGYGRGFTTFLDDRKFGGMDHSGPPAMEWLRAQSASKDKRFLLFFHGYDVHGQAPLPPDVDARSLQPAYRGPLDGGIEEQGRYREQALQAIKKPGDPASLAGKLSPQDAAFLLAVYDKKTEIADARMGQMLALLKETGAWDNAIVALVSDHGEEFMEHGAIDHGYSLYEEQLHVPMMIHFPEQKTRRDVLDPVRTLDLFPTLADALGLPQIPGTDGASLLPFLRGQSPPPGPLIAESDYRLYVHLRAIRKGDYKLILDMSDGKKELYNLRADPGEQRDLSAAEPKIAYELEQELRAELLKAQISPEQFLGRSEAPITVY